MSLIIYPAIFKNKLVSFEVASLVTRNVILSIHCGFYCEGKLLKPVPHPSG
jgi:hypothetical protein